MPGAQCLNILIILIIMSLRKRFQKCNSWSKHTFQNFWKQSYWNVAALQGCVSCICAKKWISYIHTYIHSFCKRFFSLISHYRVLSWVPCALQQVVINSSSVYLIKILQKVGIEETYINIIKAIHSFSWLGIANIIVNSEKLTAFPLRSGTKRRYPFSPLLSKCFGSPSCSNQRKRK